MLQKYHCDDLLNICAIYEAQNADNTRTLGRICFDDKLVKSLPRMTSLLSEGDSSVCN